MTAADGSPQVQTQTLWSTRWGPVIIIPRAGLNWTAKNAYALKDANAGNVRSTDSWLGFARSKNVADMQKAMGNLGMPWVTSVAHGRAAGGGDQ